MLVRKETPQTEGKSWRCARGKAAQEQEENKQDTRKETGELLTW